MCASKDECEDRVDGGGDGRGGGEKKRIVTDGSRIEGGMVVVTAKVEKKVRR